MQRRSTSRSVSCPYMRMNVVERHRSNCRLRGPQGQAVLPGSHQVHGSGSRRRYGLARLGRREDWPRDVGSDEPSCFATWYAVFGSRE